MSNGELATAVGVAPNIASERVQTLFTRGVIRRYRTEVDLGAIGRPVQALIAVRIRTSEDHLIDAFREWVACVPETVNVFVTTGGTDFVIHVAVRNTDDLYSLVVDQMTRQAGVVDVRTSLVFEHLNTHVLEPFEDGRTNRHHREGTNSQVRAT
jgi:DNA-binding Lrp family transcriptional regulator